MDRPKGDWRGKKYATWDLPVEKATIKDVMEADGGDFDKVELIPSTVTDEVTALRQIRGCHMDFLCMGRSAMTRAGRVWRLDYFAFADLDSVFDFYTPVIIANNTFLAEEPEISQGISGRGQQGI